MPAPLTAPLFLASANIIEIFERTGMVDKVIVLGLALFSLVAWTVMIAKHYELKRLRMLNHNFDAHLRVAVFGAPLEMALVHAWRDDADADFVGRTDAAGAIELPADLFADAMESYWRAAAIMKEQGIVNSRAPLEHAENAIQRAIARQTLRYESSMIFLASIVSGAPFIGLLGTVWGVMEAFSAVANQQTAGIQQLAPGVSGAMLATIAGLVVAIPSVFGYNLLLGNTREMITEIENYASSLADRLELEYK